MSEKEIVCAALDNTSLKQEGNLGNSNTTCAVQEKLLNSVGSEDVTVGLQPDEKNDHEDSEQEEFEEDVMTGSYGEISLDRELLSCAKNSDFQDSREDEKQSNENGEECANEEAVRENKRPDSLVLIKSSSNFSADELVASDKESTYVQQVHKSQQTSDGRTSDEVSPSVSSEEFALHCSGRGRTNSDTSGLSELQGTLTVDGDMVTFVAEDLHEKIKMSSPVSRWTDSSSFPGSRSSTPSLPRQVLQSSVHVIDPNILTDLEMHAKKVATCLDTMLENLSGTLQSISSLTVECMETYENSVCKTCDAVDVNIKAVYQLMAKCEELSNSMNPLYRISGDIKHIKKMLDQLEHIVEHKS
ncbi:BLOC-1-related complex subunit 6-like [Stegodyphus dumicola]|uniref:BLOC-1-related complex subunit 6-like n=1 Tax=Stegodyphus dumicola TaxID=202533 RepID=UPI0015ACC099|nr:BLOC-1-related complex subunit 6-like [Stegodyphus dumicola]